MCSYVFCVALKSDIGLGLGVVQVVGQIFVTLLLPLTFGSSINFYPGLYIEFCPGLCFGYVLS